MESLDCTDIKALLSGLIDDRVDPASRHHAERHLADCKSCRKLLDQAEAAEAMVAASIAALGDAEPLPDQFESTVLARTIYADRHGTHGRLMNWIGWLAAAAALALAVSIWVTNPRAGFRASAPEFALADPYQVGPEVRSYTRDGVGSPDERSLDSTVALGGNTTRVQPASYRPDPSSFIELNRLSMMPSRSGPSVQRTEARAAGLSRAHALSRDDSETLDDVSRLMMMLAQSPDQSFVEVERIRRIAEYDRLLPRLARLRANLAPQDRTAVIAAESVLYRVVRGPVSSEDVQEMRDAVSQLELARRLEAIGNRWSPASSL